MCSCSSKKPEDLPIVEKNASIIISLARVGKCVVSDKPVTAGCVRKVVSLDCDAYLEVKGLIDAKAECAKITKKIDSLIKLEKEIQNKKLNKNYLKVPQNVRDENEKRLVQYSNEREELLKCQDELKLLITE